MSTNNYYANIYYSPEEEKRLRELQEEINKIHKLKFSQCNHRDRGPLIPLADYIAGLKERRRDVPERFKELSEDVEQMSKGEGEIEQVVVHPSCGATFSMDEQSPEKIREALFRLESICHQIKYFAGNKDNNDDINNYMVQIEQMRNDLIPYYRSMVKSLLEQDKQKGNDNRRQSNRQIGGYGITPGMLRSSGGRY